jgi:UDP-N-acetyl-2-amino-2-deoxyglucuronate dehydrogenase
MLALKFVALRGLVLIGCGWIARRHAVAARRLGVPLLVASRDLARARAFARDFGAADAFGAYEDAARDPRASAAVICTPHDRHCADTLRALGAGLHVLVEKPIAPTVEEADRMIAAAQAAGRVLMVAENFRFMPAFRHVHGLLAAGAVGPLRSLHLVARGYRQHAGWRLVPGAVGGGVLIDGGIHYVHNLRWWGGEVRRVFALRLPQTVDLGGEDAVDLLAELSEGVVGFLSNSLGARGVPRVQWSSVTGADGTIFADNRGRLIVVRGRGRTRVRLFRRDTRGHEAMLRAFADSVASGRPPESDGASGRRDLAVVLAAYRSVAERRPVDLAC